MTRIAIALLATVALTVTAQAADLLVEPAAAPAVASDYDWTGFYLGAQAGYFAGSASWQNIAPDTRYSEGSPEAAAFGVYGGYNIDLGSIVLGIGGQYNVTDASDTQPFVTPVLGESATFDVTGYGSIDASLGIDLGQFKPYAVVGAAAANLDIYYDGVPDEDYATETLWGWTAGIGADVALTDSIVARLEYRHADYGTKDVVSEVTIPSVGDSHEIALTSDTLTAGLAFKF
jgi:outer membrane immunogenic protein